MTTRKGSGERQAALLRGINVGRAKRVAMADLRALVSDLGYRDVGTLLNSGNVVFTCPRGTARESAARIEKALEEKLGVTSRVFGLSAGELAAVIARNPLLSIADNPSRLMVAVLADPSVRPRIAPLEKQDWDGEAIRVVSRAAYLWFPEGIIVSKLNAAFARALGDDVTIRNWATILKLGEMLGRDSVKG